MTPLTKEERNLLALSLSPGQGRAAQRVPRCRAAARQSRLEGCCDRRPSRPPWRQAQSIDSLTARAERFEGERDEANEALHAVRALVEATSEDVCHDVRAIMEERDEARADLKSAAAAYDAQSQDYLERIARLEAVAKASRHLHEQVGDGDNGPSPYFNDAWYALDEALRALDAEAVKP